ncbi:putative membrane protein [Yersinia rochesterensis]|uniref:Membrane protein n=1 Tax=Yersinia rochesterensis TaxID=1604335 RepID=A0ABN4FIH8_9GAMM|nr:putative membrane protein [Yersinia rochesterensis]AJI85478.1 putative membrane protein [Yersinia frederiksenii Y225]AJJ35013.1 putative membrane protein [Yersinia rochesterensis]CRY63054.1 Uncharacterised protein [Yersinia kristensenii]
MKDAFWFGAVIGFACGLALSSAIVHGLIPGVTMG